MECGGYCNLFIRQADVRVSSLRVDKILCKQVNHNGHSRPIYGTAMNLLDKRTTFVFYIEILNPNLG